MSISQVQAMLERRGYQVEIRRQAIRHSYHLNADTQHVEYAMEPQPSTPWIAVHHGGQTTYICVTDSDMAEGKGHRTAHFFDKCLGQGQHHMACASCKEPLLQTTNLPSVDLAETPLEDIGGRTLFYIYRSAKAGPASEPMTMCSQCGTALDIGTVAEIDDQFDAQIEVPNSVESATCNGEPAATPKIHTQILRGEEIKAALTSTYWTQVTTDSLQSDSARIVTHGTTATRPPWTYKSALKERAKQQTKQRQRRRNRAQLRKTQQGRA